MRKEKSDFMHALPLLKFPELQTNRMVLRTLYEDDAEEMFIQRSHPVIQKYIVRSPTKDVEEALAFIRKVLIQEKEGLSITWALVPKTHKKLIGTICLWNIEKENSTAELGYSLHPDYFGKGWMNEAVMAVTAFGFEKIHLTRIDAFTHKDNKASIKLLERNGYTRNKNMESTYPDREEMLYNTIYSQLNK